MLARQTFSFEDLGKNFGSQTQKNSSYRPQKNYPPTAKIETATAPYNFVPLPEKVLASEIENVDAFKNHICERGKISGEIELEMEALTPLFFGGNGEKSFAPAEKFIIPGSSLRGMFKNIFKIVTCGTFRGRTDSQKKGEDFNDEHIYFRCLMASNSAPQWMNDLCKTYKARMEGEKGKNARPGFLIQTLDNKYFIAPLLPNPERKNDFIMMKDFQENFRPVRFKDSCVYWDFAKKRAYILTGNQWANRPEKLLTLEQYEKFKESLKGLTEGARTQKIKNTNHGKQIIRYFKIEDIDWSKRIELPDEVLKSYEHDRNRRGVNLFKDNGILKREQLEKLCKNLPADIKTLIPCHFLYEDNRVTAFGHGQFFRIPYKNTIGNIVPENLKSSEVIDLADAVFGLKENWASRVFFEDAEPISEIETLQKSASHPLMQPNPTSYQFYLNQSSEILNHWDKNNAILRGYKLYWHNGKWDWKANNDEKRLDAGKPPEKRLTKDLTPLKNGSKFISKIRFRNLSAVELGALLMIFDLNGTKNSYYKIGMGKPLGFGSIKITPKLFIESEDAYSTEIFDSNGFKSPYKASDTKTYIKAFKDYLSGKIKLTTWQKIMKKLNSILDWENKPASEKIKYMSGDVSQKGGVDERFKQRAPLPNISAVK